MKKFYKFPLKTKFFFSMSSLITMTVLLLFFGIFFVFYGYFMAFQTDASSNQLRAVKNQLDFYLTSMDQYASMIVSDPTVQGNVRDYNTASFSYTESDRTALRTQMRKFLQSTPYIHSATIYGIDQTSITTTAIVSLPALPLSVLPKRGPLFTTGKKYSNYQFTEKVDALSMIRPFFEIDSGALLGYIELTIIEEDISALYRSNSSATSRFFVTDSQGTVVSTDGSRPLNSVYSYAGQYTGRTSGSFFSKEGTICFVTYVDILDWYIINEIKLTAFFLPLLFILVICILITVVFLFIALLVSRKISGTITRPLYLLISHIQKVKSGNWSPLNNKPHDQDFLLLFEEFDSMLTSQERLTSQLVNAQREKDRLATDLLYQQVNPHFLYNTLDNIVSLATLDEKDRLIHIVMSLSEFYRKSLSGGQTVITIREELALTRAYVSIMQIRYMDKFTFSVSCPEELQSCLCLKLLLQPLIENSIYHGIKESEEKGIISITVTEQNEKIIFDIEDNGPGISPETLLELPDCTTGHFGLKSVRRRIRMYYNDNCDMNIENRLPHGLKITILIPKSKGDSL